MRTFPFLLLTLSLVCFTGTAVVFGNDTIVIGGDRDYPPYEWLDHDGKPVGFLVDISKAVTNATGFKVEIKLGEWNEIKKGLERGKIDAIEGMFYSPERDVQFDFSNPHSEVTHAIFVWKEDESIRSLKDLKGRSVFSMRGDIMHEYLLSEKLGLHLMLTRTQREALELLSTHRGQAAVIARLPGLYYMKELGLDDIKMVGKPIQPLEFCFAVREGNQEILSKLNEGLAIIRQSGEYKEIVAKWLGILEPKYTWKDFLPGLIILFGALLLLLGFLFVWNWMLEKEVRRKTEELRIANEQLQRIGQFKTDVVNSVAHEFKTPLGVMQGYMDYLLDGSVGVLSEKQLTIGKKVEKTINRLVRLVSDLLDVAKLEAGKISLNIKTIDVSSMVNEVEGFFQEQFQSKKIRFAKKVEPKNLSFYGDRDRLEQCLINLIDNAIKFSNEESSIGLSVLGRDHEVRFEIQDQGRGIPKESLAKLFEKFQRFDPEGVSRGYGLGLAITRDFVELHRGQIWAESKEGEGSKFIFVIPKDLHRSSQK